MNGEPGTANGERRNDYLEDEHDDDSLFSGFWI
jgi:hypothetical protein